MVKSPVGQILKIISLLSLAMILIAGVMAFRRDWTTTTYLWWMNASTVVWFVTSPWWMIVKKKV